jgi:hypothetical protein
VDVWVVIALLIFLLALAPSDWWDELGRWIDVVVRWLRGGDRS